MDCSKCGSHLEPDDLFCGNCGQVVDQVEPARQEKPEQEDITQIHDGALETIVSDQKTPIQEQRQPPPAPPPEPLQPIASQPAVPQPAQAPPRERQYAQPVPGQPPSQPAYSQPAQPITGTSRFRFWYWIAGAAIILCICLAIATASGLYLYQDDFEFGSSPTEESTFKRSATTRPTEEGISIFPGSDETDVTVEPIVIEVVTEVVVEPGDNTSLEDSTVPAGERSVLSQALLDTGLVFVGVHSFDLWPMNVETGDERIGFEIWLAEEIVWRMFGDEVEIEWVPVSASERFEMVESGAIDMLIRSTTHTTSREEYGLWSHNYFLSGYRIAANPDRGISSLDDLALKDVAVVGGTVVELVLLEEAVKADVGLYPVQYDNYIDACDSFLNGDVDAMIGDWINLLNCTEGDPGFIIVTDLLASDNDGDGVLNAEPFAVVVPPWDPTFLAEVDAALLEIIEDGTWQQIYDIWFEEPPPWTLEQMLNAPPVDR